MIRFVVILGLLGACERTTPPARTKPAQDPPATIEALAAACGAGDQHACARKGFYLIADNRDPARVAEAQHLWTTACDRIADPLACSNLGTLYADGEGVAKDEARALALWMKACDKDDNVACGFAGSSYAAGRGTAIDRPRGFALADKGCRLGSPGSCTTLGFAYVEGWNGAPDVKRGAQLFRDACEHQNAGGCFQLGLAMRDGRGVSRDLGQARAFVEKACAAGLDRERCDEVLAAWPASAQ